MFNFEIKKGNKKKTQAPEKYGLSFQISPYLRMTDMEKNTPNKKQKR